MSQNRNDSIVGKKIGKYDLVVGQWIKFSTSDKELSKASEKTKKFYQQEQLFLVLNRDDVMFDSCRCFLIDVSSVIYDYCPRMHELNFTSLIWNHEITTFSHNEVETIYGKNKINAFYNAICEGINNPKSEYMASLLKVRKWKIENIITEKDYTSGALAGALKRDLAKELYGFLGTFLTPKEGGRLAQTCKSARDNADLEKNIKLISLRK